MISIPTAPFCIDFCARTAATSALRSPRARAGCAGDAAKARAQSRSGRRGKRFIRETFVAINSCADVSGRSRSPGRRRRNYARHGGSFAARTEPARGYRQLGRPQGNEPAKNAERGVAPPGEVQKNARTANKNCHAGGRGEEEPLIRHRYNAGSLFSDKYQAT